MRDRHRPSIHQIKKEVQITTSRSGGPGGQHVNKVESKVTLRWNIRESVVVGEEAKETLLSALSSKLTQAGEILITAEDSRSQIKNKEIVFKKLDRLLTAVFTKKKTRRATTPSKSAQRKRLTEKKIHGEKKKWRQGPKDF